MNRRSAAGRSAARHRVAGDPAACNCAARNNHPDRTRQTATKQLIIKFGRNGDTYLTWSHPGKVGRRHTDRGIWPMSKLHARPSLQYRYEHYDPKG